MSALSAFAQKYQSNLVGGLVGGAVGSAIGGIGTDRYEEESDESFKGRRRGNLVSGALAGAGVGVAAPMAINAIKGSPEQPPGLLKKLWNFYSPGNNDVTAAAAGAGVGGGARYIAGKAIGLVPQKSMGVEVDNLLKMLPSAKAVGGDAAQQLLHGRILSHQGPIKAAGKLGLILAGLTGAARAFFGPKLNN